MGVGGVGGTLGFGAFSYDLAHLLGGAVLVLSFALLYQRRITAVIHIYTLQAWVLAAAAAWQAWVQGSADLYVTALIALSAKGVAIPVALHTIVRRLNIHRAIETAFGVFPSMAVGVALVVLSIMVVLPTTMDSQILTREDLSLALSVVLLGQLMMITRRSALTQVIGFMSVENGLILAAVGVKGMPLVVELSVGVLVLIGATVFGVFFFRIRERFESLDVSHLDRVTGTYR
ncbi:Hydrogenase-4 component E [Rhodovastum atsumiense]|uniref:Hydrogenase-4 component E n=1 Tax=Rhodovastum atsumiense TaxID=504468 RepID=A0A5M6J032_9PROT|nr:hydrogenase-4 component E [Rhodovastum atsumiense]KAA5612948.1 hydrogenase-4 component E [Rhodovastum atsumiense]CAH2600960.1 Hydrogenase-4 component E [Rhodovastum atsumiense]